MQWLLETRLIFHDIFVKLDDIDGILLACNPNCADLVEMIFISSYPLIVMLIFLPH